MASDALGKQSRNEIEAGQDAAIVARAEAEAQRISTATARAEAVLAGLLDWVGKTDSRTAFLFAVNTALGGLALTNLAVSGWSVFEVVLFVGYFVLFTMSALNLILVQYPNITSPNRSMLFFGTIAGNASDDFISRFSSMTDDDYLRDVLHQCHVNSMVLVKKFQRLQRATRYMIASSFVWLLIVAVPTVNSDAAHRFFGQFFASQSVNSPAVQTDSSR